MAIRRDSLVQTVSPDTGTTLFLRDAAGNLKQKIEAFGGASQRSTHYAYDGLDRLTAIDLPNDPDWAFTYDSSTTLNQKGRLASVSNGQITTEIAYTARGQVAFEKTIVDGLSYSVVFFYDAAGNRTRIVSADGFAAQVDYSGLRPAAVTLGSGSQPHIRNIAWYPFGPRTHAEFPPFDTGTGANTVTSTREMNLRGQMTRVLVETDSGSVLDRTYTYDYDDGVPGPVDPGPNLDRVVDAVDPAESRFFFYDELDRLWSATGLSGNVLFEYGYDEVGNRTSLTAPAGNTTYSYEASTNRLDGASGTGALDYAHDAFGNRIYQGAAPYAGTPSLIFNESNRLVEVRDPDNGFSSIATYRYDAFGRRVQRITPTKTFVYLYDPEGKLLQEVEKRTSAADHTRVYVYLEDELVALVDSVVEVGTSSLWPMLLRLRPVSPESVGWVLLFALAGSGVLLLVARRNPAAATAMTSATLVIFTCAGTPRPPPLISWVHTDPLGTPRAVTNNAVMPGDAEAIWRASYEPFGKATVDEDPDGDMAPFSLHVRFPGQYEDLETGWYYNFYRTYDPATGRYLEADPAGASGGFALYPYARGNPVRFVDRAGAAPEDGSSIGNPFWFGLGPPTPEQHFNRNRNNRCPARPPTGCEGWSQDPTWYARKKFRHSDGYECAYDNLGNLLPDATAANGTQNYSFNYAPGGGSFLGEFFSPRHFIQDIWPHFSYDGVYPPGLTQPFEGCDCGGK